MVFREKNLMTSTERETMGNNNAEKLLRKVIYSFLGNSPASEF